MDEIATPFHKGELAIQDKVGVRDLVHTFAPRVIRPFMPDQHRAFFYNLPYLFAGALDGEDMPWATIWFDKPGFVSTPDACTLEITDVKQGGDPVSMCLEVGSEIGLLGLMLHNRRRNRVNGRLKALGSGKITVTVSQSFGNCPKYIQARAYETAHMGEALPEPVQTRVSLSADDLQLIEWADTFFIASAAKNAGASNERGVDVSHRGGAPGFVKAIGDDRLIFPDFSGNNYFNTLGNIHETGKAGLLFIDFETGDILQVTGMAEILWPEDCEWQYEGAERYVMFTVKKLVRRNGAIPKGWYFIKASPFVPYASQWRRK